MRRVLLAVAVASVLWTTGSRAASWSYASTDHFEAYVAAGESQAREVVTSFERFRGSFDRIFNVPPEASRRATIVVFSSAREFAPYRPQDNSVAFWLDTPPGDFIVMQSFDEEAMQNALHEFTHLTVAQTGADYPLWLNEGLAEFYSTMARSGSKVRIGGALPNAVDTLGRGSALIPLPALFALDEQSPEGRDPRVAAWFYSQSWALTHMLLMGDSYRDRTAAAFAAIAGGAAAADALPAAYHRSLDQMAGDLKSYLLRYRFASRLTDVPRASTDPRVMSKPAETVNVDVTLASILGWQATHQAQGLEQLDALEARAPGNLHLLETRGLIEYYSQRCDAARADLSQAVRFKSQSPAVLAAYGVLTGHAAAAARQMFSMMSSADPSAAGHAHVLLTPCAAAAVTAR